MKGIVLAVDDEHADEVARLIAAALSLNGFGHNSPSVIDLPDTTNGSAVAPQPRPKRTGESSVQRLLRESKESEESSP